MKDNPLPLAIVLVVSIGLFAVAAFIWSDRNIQLLSFVVASAINLSGLLYKEVEANRLKKEKKKIDEEKDRLDKEKRTFNWEDLQNAAKDLSRSMKDDNFIPDLIFAPGATGGIIAHLLEDCLSEIVPVIVGTSIYRADVISTEETKRVMELKKYYELKHVRWYYYIPEMVFYNKNAKILIVDDLAMTGTFLNEMKQLFVEKGFTNIVKSACMVTTTVAQANGWAPDYQWKTLESAEFYFPWGKAR